MAVKLNTETFIERSKSVHGEKYDYSLVDYNGNNTKVKIICREHNIVFEQRPASHYSKEGCPECLPLKLLSSNDHFIKKSKSVHGETYDYSLVKYSGVHNKVKIICKSHGIFDQKPLLHYMGNGCKKCGYERSTSSKTHDTEKFIENAIKVHGNIYDYSRVKDNYVNSMTKVEIICKKHGRSFWQTFQNHVNGRGCRICSESSGERAIRLFMENNNIPFVREKRFKGCRNIRALPFDFYLPENNI